MHQQQQEDVLCRVVDGEALLLDTRTGDYFSLDPLGTEIWLRLGAGDAVEDIAASIAERHAVDTAQVRGDIDELLSGLRDAGLWS